MNFTIISALISIKRILYDKFFLATLLFLPLTLIVVSFIFANKVPVSIIKAGIIISESDDFAQSIIDDLPQNPQLVFEKFSIKQRKLVEDLVKSGKLECAYILDNNIQSAILTGNITESITILRKNNSVAEPIFSEILFSVILNRASVAISSNQIKLKLGGNIEQIKSEISEKILWYKSQNSYMNPKYEVENIADNPEYEFSNNNSKKILHAILALFLTSLTIFLLPRFIDEKNNSLWKNMNKKVYSYYLGLLLSFVFINCFVGIIGISTASIIFPSALSPILNEVILLILYSTAISSLGICFVIYCKNSDSIFSGGIFLIILTCIFGGAFINWSEVNSTISKFSKIFFLNSYLNGIINFSINEIYIFVLIIFTASIASYLKLNFYLQYN